MSTALLERSDTDHLAAASVLQRLLPRLVAVALDAKQAHWNVTGAAFLPLHALTDELAADLGAWSDRVAERAVAAGMAVDARPETVASTVTQPFPTGSVADWEVIAELISRLEELIAVIHGYLGDLESLDAVAHDAVIEILEGLEKYHWMLRASSR